jgi:acetylornithine/succinyldiaminopimelate/putrescine aminotransferase
VNQGHCHPKILEAMLEQAHKVTLTSRAFRNDQLPLLLQELHELTGFDKALPMNSGAEAVETAIKAARKWGYTVKGIPEHRAEIIVCANNFYGRTVTIVSFSTAEQYRDGFGPFTPGFKVIPFGDANALRDAITPNTYAFLVEPIQGEAGIIIPPDGFLKQAAAICHVNQVLLTVDEIQSGLGRTGELFAFMHEGIRPDVVIIGKALSGGFWMSFMAPNAVLLHAEPLVGLEQISAGMAKNFNAPGFQLTWEPTKAEFVGNGPFGYTIDRYEAKFTGDDGKPHSAHGSYMTTWQKQHDGSWKVVADIGSPDPE